MKLNFKKSVVLLLSAMMLFVCLSVGVNAEEEKAPFTPDTSWYDPDDVKTEYTLTTAQQLAGMATLIYPTNESGATPVTFLNVTIKLGADIVFNYGDASTWSDLFLLDEELYNSMVNWANYTPYVAKRVGFEGTLDGQGHYISGLYASNISTSGGLALFERTNNATIKNLSLVNSKIEGMRYSAALIGVAAGNTTIENVYTNVYINAGGTEGGGLIGATTTENGVTKISNTVVSGEVIASNLAGGLIGNAGNKVGTVDCENVLVAARIKGKKIAGISANQFAENTVKLNNFVVAADFVVNSGSGNRAANLLNHSSDSAKQIVDHYTNVYALDNGLEDNESANVTCTNGGTATEKTADELKNLILEGWTAVSDSYPMPNYCKSLYDKYQADKTTLQTVPVPDQPTVPGDDVENPGNGDDNGDDQQTEVPTEARTEAPTATPTDAVQGSDNGGCQSVILSSVSGLMMVAATAVAVLWKKRED